MKAVEPLPLSTLALDDRTEQMLRMFLQGPCNNLGVLVSEGSAQATIIDMDAFQAQSILKEYLEKKLNRPIIALSLIQQEFPNAIFVRKPVQKQSLIEALTLAKRRINGTEAYVSPDPIFVSEPKPQPEQPISRPKGIIPSRPDASSKHKTAVDLAEKGFSQFIGSLVDFDANNKEKLSKAYYDPRKHLQGYVQEAIKTSIQKNRIIRLNSGWRPITIFPQSREVWVDANDTQLRLICAVPLDSMSSIDVNNDNTQNRPFIEVVRSDEIDDSGNAEKFQSIEIFLWKVALWSSRGRVPIGIDLNQPLYLLRWPNLTRLLMIPQFIRIAALMMITPHSLLDLSDILKVKHQYVFAFFSAVAALGLAGKANRQADTLIAPQKPVPNKHSSFLGRIMSRLRAIT